MCAVSGFGHNYTITWYNGHNLIINHSHVLDIPHVQLNDSGNYYCVVSNESGVVNRPATLATLKVIGK